MRKFPVCVGSSHFSTNWAPTEFTEDELWEMIQNPVRTAETVEEYKRLDDDARSAAKDRGGIFGGRLNGSRKLKSAVLSRSIINFDIDHFPPEKLESFTFRYRSILYTTHSHTPDNPHVRIFIFLTRDITVKEYYAISSYLAGEIGIDLIDKCSFRINQMMYWPTVSSDGEYICKRFENGEWLDPDVFLSEHPGWEDAKNRPEIPDINFTETNNPLPDPLTKGGAIADFCEAYTLYDGITTFLSDVYEPTDSDDRFRYIKGSGPAGLLLFGNYAYSFHGSDPASGHCRHIYDLVRIHRFGDNKDSMKKMNDFVNSDEKVKAIIAERKKAEAAEDFEPVEKTWDEPIPFPEMQPVSFPLEALPERIRNFVVAIAESTQTSPALAANACLAILAVCAQKKYVIRGKPDWVEQLCLLLLVAMEPSERKSAVESLAARPLNNFEMNYNLQNRARYEKNRSEYRVLLSRQKDLEMQAAKGKTVGTELDEVNEKVAGFREAHQLKLYVDDVTMEKLASIIEANNGRAAILSTEGGIFEKLMGMYSGSPNFDIILKAYSGDDIRVDRIGRDSVLIRNPALTMMLMTQPSVLSNLMSNREFRGRGLLARYLYAIPESRVGERSFDSVPVDPEIYRKYEELIYNILEDVCLEEEITLSRDAHNSLRAFADELEPRLNKDLKDISDWAGKLTGNILRISGLLCRASVLINHDFLEVPEKLTVSGETMENAITIGRYYLDSAVQVFGMMECDDIISRCKYAIERIRASDLRTFTGRDLMRSGSKLKKIENTANVITALIEYGYIEPVSGVACNEISRGRKPSQVYAANPYIFKKE